MKREKLITGVIPALVTPFDNEGQLDLSIVPRLVKGLLDKRISGFFVCGATGEHRDLNLHERMVMASTVLSETASHVPVIIHVGGVGAEDASALAKHAVALGAGGIGTIPPDNTNGDLSAAVDYYSKIAYAIPHTPFYVYWRQETAVNASPEQFLDEMSRIPNFAGLKFTSHDLYYFKRLKKISDGELNLLTGADELFLEGLVSGSDGAIGTTYNFMPEHFIKIYSLFKENNIADAMPLQDSATSLIAQILSIPNGLNSLYSPIHPAKYFTEKVIGVKVGQPRLKKEIMSEESLRELWDNIAFHSIIDFNS